MKKTRINTTLFRHGFTPINTVFYFLLLPFYFVFSVSSEPALSAVEGCSVAKLLFVSGFKYE